MEKSTSSKLETPSLRLRVKKSVSKSNFVLGLCNRFSNVGLSDALLNKGFRENDEIMITLIKRGGFDIPWQGRLI